MGEFRVMTKDGARMVSGKPVPGTRGHIVATRDLSGEGWTLTHHGSGLRMPGEAWRSQRAAIDAWSALVGRMPDALDIVLALADGSVSDADMARLRDAWQAVLYGEPMPTWDELTREVLGSIGALEDGWHYSGDQLTCPCGYAIEDDGRCPSGCVSPLLSAGVI